MCGGDGERLAPGEVEGPGGEIVFGECLPWVQ